MKLNSLIKQFLGLTIVLAMSLTLVPLPAMAAGKNPYTSLYSATMVDGEVKQIGNSVLECAQDSTITTASCDTAKNFAPLQGSLTYGNDKFMMKAVDVDGDSATNNSSSADLVIPAGFKVKEAFAFWGGSWGGGLNDPSCRDRQNIAICGDSSSTYATLANGNEKNAKVKIGASAYQNLTASNSYFLTSQARGYYASNVSVGSLLAPLPAGTHKITMSLDVISAGWLGGFNGWSLFTILEKIDLSQSCDITQPSPVLKNISISDGMILTSDQGFDTADAKVNVNVDITGFKIPSTGGAGSNIYMSTLDGDPEYNLDTFTLGPVTGTEVGYDRGGDTLPNPFRSYIDPLSNSNRLPNNTNTFGYDIIANNLNAQGGIAFPAGATSVKSIFKGGFAAAPTNNEADRFAPMYLALETPTEAPFVCIVKDSIPVPNTTVKVGDIIEYKLRHISNGSANTANDITKDTIPVGTTYVPSSLSVDGIPQTDATGDDKASFDGTTVFFSPTNGVALKQTIREYSFKVKVTDLAMVGMTVDNQAKVEYTNPSIPTNPMITVQSNIVKHPIIAPDAPIVTLVKSSVPPSGTPVTVNDEITYTLVAQNTGLGDATAQITKDKIPTGTTYVPSSLSVDGIPQTDATGDDGAAYDANAIGGAEVRYSPSAGLLAAGTQKTFTFKVKVTDSTVPVIRNVGSITFTDPTKPTPTTIPSNEVSHPQASGPQMNIVKSSVPPSGTDVNFNDIIEYTLTATNTGLGKATNVIISDVIPTSAMYVEGSASNGGVYDPMTKKITWTIPEVLPGNTVTDSFKVKVMPINGETMVRNIGMLRYTNPLNPSVPVDVPSNVIEHPLFACVGDYIWIDTNKNGIQDADEQGIAGVDVMIMKKGTTVALMSTKTDLMGYYQFCLPKGDYDIKVMIPGGHTPTIMKTGFDKTDSNIDSMGMMSVTLTAGQMNYDMDGGLVKVELPTPRTGGSNLPIIAFGSLILIASFLLVENKRRSNQADSYRSSGR